MLELEPWDVPHPPDVPQPPALKSLQPAKGINSAMTNRIRNTFLMTLLLSCPNSNQLVVHSEYNSSSCPICWIPSHITKKPGE